MYFANTYMYIYIKHRRIYSNLSSCKVNTHRIAAVLKVETDIISSISASPIGQSLIVEIMYVETFKSDRIAFIGDIIVFDVILINMSSIRVIPLILAISLDEFKRKTSKSPMKYYIHMYKHIKIIYKVYHTLISDVGVGERKTNEVFFSLSLSCRNSSFTIPPLRPLMPVRLIRSFSLNFVSFISLFLMYSLCMRYVTAPINKDPIRILKAIST